MSRSIYAQLHRRYGPRESETSRRDFLKGVTALGAAMLLSSCTSKEEKIQQMAASKHVLVVGGGFAGLACAHELRSAGYTVKVIEARNRVGGRVVSFSDFIPNRIIEGGGELIGTNHPLWNAYADQFGLELLDIAEDDSLNAPLILDGKLLSAEDGKKLYDEMTKAQATMTDDARTVDENEPWKSPNATAMDLKTASQWVDGCGASRLCKLALAASLEGNNAVPLHLQSYLGNLAQVKGGGLEKYWTDTELRHCKMGNQELANSLVDGIGAENVLISTTIDTISSGKSGAIVTTSDGVKFEGDDVVVTIPPSMWPTVKFVPLLPAELNPQMGTGVKYIAMVKSRFWKAANLSAESETDGAISMTWESTKGQGTAGSDGKPAGLVAFSGGPAADICRKIPADDRDGVYAKAMERLYPGFTEQFVKPRFMDWPSDKLTRASYSFPAPGQVTSQGPMLHEGMGRMHFAGEHTCYKFVGYMEGALDSGVRIARKIALRDGLPIRAAVTRPTVKV